MRSWRKDHPLEGGVCVLAIELPLPSTVHVLPCTVRMDSGHIPPATCIECRVGSGQLRTLQLELQQFLHAGLRTLTSDHLDDKILELATSLASMGIAFSP